MLFFALLAVLTAVAALFTREWPARMRIAMAVAESDAKTRRVDARDLFRRGIPGQHP